MKLASSLAINSFKWGGETTRCEARARGSCNGSSPEKHIEIKVGGIFNLVFG